MPTEDVQSVASGDFNGDGKADLVLPSPLSGSVKVYLADGTGGFATPISLPVSNLPQQVVTGDFNGDGKLDIVSIATVPGVPPDIPPNSTLAFFAGNGSGGFAPAVEITIPNPFPYPNAVAVGDFNGDGKLDLAVTYPSAIHLFLGNGSGSFSAGVTLNFSSTPIGLAVGDFNGDGKLDIAVTTSNSVSLIYKLIVFLGDGLGSFPTQRQTPLAEDPLAGGGLAVGLFNGDANLDVAVGFGQNSAGTPSSTVSVFLGDGTGLFGTPTNYSVDPGYKYIRVGDVNGDSHSDLLVVSASAGLAVLLGNGAGGFGAPKRFTTGPAPTGEVIADFNGDGKLDVATANGGYGYTVLLGNGDGTFGSTVTNPSATTPRVAVTGDFNGDGKPDIAVTADLPGGLRGFEVFLGTGLGTFNLPTAVPTGGIAGPYSAVVADFNFDGKLDIAFVDITNAFYVLPGNGTGGFGPVQTYGAVLPFPPISLTSADLNGDGKPDLVFTDLHGVGVALNNGTGGFPSVTRYAAGNQPDAAAIGDFNGDGKPDIAAVNNISGDVSILLNQGNGTFQDGVNFAVSPLGGMHSLVVGDFNDDNKMDVVVAAARANTVALLLGDGTGGLSAPITILPGIHIPDEVAVGDFNLDGKLDLVVTSPTANAAEILIGDGAGHFTLTGAQLTGLYTQSPIVADFNLDGKPDIATSNRLSNDLTILLNTTLPSPSAVITAPPSVCPNSTGNTVSVPDAGLGASYSWSITGGTITAGSGTRSITFSAEPGGPVSLNVTVTGGNGCSSIGSVSVVVGGACPQRFYTVSPCRLLDTRNPVGPLGGPALIAGNNRAFPVAGHCAVPTTAVALSVNVVAVTPTTGPGFFTIYPTGGSRPLFSTINYSAGQIRANNAVISMGAAGNVTVFCGQGFGTADLVIDVNGYFQ